MKTRTNFFKNSILKMLLLFLIHSSISNAQTRTVLMFVDHEQTYYSEYIVMRAALEAAGYTIDLRSSVEGLASLYMLPVGIDIEETANTMPNGSSYEDFTMQFQNLFGTSWDAGLNTTPNHVNVDGRIQDITDMSAYDALVIVGGIGALSYRVDGTYVAKEMLSALEVEEVAEKLNTLGLEALQAGKPVMAQCHGASIPAFWRIPETSGPGEEAIGYSLLKGGNATGYPEPETPEDLATLDINHMEFGRVVVSSPHSSFDDGGYGDYKIITTRDWYPQTVAYAARTLLNVLETYPDQEAMQNEIATLILHGGSVDETDCHPSNRDNDIPCNYGNDALNIPADYTHLQTLLSANSSNDVYNINVTELNITGGALPFDPNDQASIATYLSLYQVVVFFKHWSTGVTEAMQNALIAYADSGGGVLALHHGLYNDIDNADPTLNKTSITSQLFGAVSSESGFSASLTTYNLYATNYGHFVSTYGIAYADPATQAPEAWLTVPLIEEANASFSYYENFEIYDEIYTNMTFLPGQTFGRGVNDVNPIFSNNATPEAQSHTSGFVKYFDPFEDGSIGKLAYYQPGERQENFEIDSAYGQLIRNTVVWLANDANAVLLSSEDIAAPEIASKPILYPNPTFGEVTVSLTKAINNANISLYDIHGTLLMQRTKVSGNHFTFDISDRARGVYFLRISTQGHTSGIQLIKQ